VFLQHLGTGVREVLGRDAWVQAALAKLPPNAVITDVRFQNEAEAIVERGGKVWRLERPGHGPINDHVSEHDMDEWPFDLVLPNDGSIQDLRARIRRLLTTAR
jgi:hypothetical protein